MNFQQIRELDINELANGSLLVKLVFILFFCFFLAGAGYYYLIANSLTVFTSEKNKESEFKLEFESKSMLANSLITYREQNIKLGEMVDTQLKQLPNTHEVAGLIDDISFIATDNGLQLKRINWEPEIKHEFSTELPMRIEVVGNYHELGKFTADMAALPRIVILDSFSLVQSKEDSDLISMSMVAKTYKYNDKSVEQEK
ncbi:PilO family type IV pilus biogenesis protein TapO [Aeromonas cavernicola]|uniref:Pilus assembly protein PilP n=1 Tax=Aeromonas cavernicola TaxID=1006623 RepID=A0A2H9U9M3_9GAMM|nr:PilO family type IV pilus biogenesis protein TapO [Aeromonas cavernicola]PJG60724.1 pilus assembly protein PilP [Aeromonas cavernicola]